MAGEGEKKEGFRVVDRRVSAEPQPPEGAQPVSGPGWQMKEPKEQGPEATLPPMDFTTFCLSLASSAMIHLGLSPHPESGQVQASLPLAKQTIDILALLEEKTRNNLSEHESKLLATVLYDLRLRYLEVRGRDPSQDQR